jgi:hypothetical protein
MKRTLLALLVMLLAAGCNLGSSSDPVATATAVNGSVQATTLTSPRVIAWNSKTKTLGWVQQGASVPLETGLGERAVVQLCGTSPDNKQAILYAGGESAQPTLYPVEGGDRVPLGETLGLACSIRRRIQHSPDGKRIALMQYTPNAATANFLVGSLRIGNLPDAKTTYLVNDVAGFELYDDGAVYVQLYSNGAGQARTAALRWWDAATGQQRTLEDPIRALENCQFVTGRALRVGDKAYTLFGERCQNRGSIWRLLKTDMAGGNSVNVQSGATGGVYFPNAGSNDLWSLPATNEVLVAFPNGLATDVVNLVRVSLADGTVRGVLSGVIVDQYPPSNMRRLALSPDQQSVTLVTRDGNGGETLYLYRLNTPETAPILIAGGNRSDRINGVGWSGDNQRIYYLLASDANGLYLFNLAGEAKLVLRGTFQNLALSPDGSLAAASEQVRVDTNDLRNHLVVINTGTLEKTVLAEGARGEPAQVPLLVR